MGHQIADIVDIVNLDSGPEDDSELSDTVSKIPLEVNHSEPPQTFLNRFNTEKARCVEVIVTLCVITGLKLYCVVILSCMYILVLCNPHPVYGYSLLRHI